MNFYGSGMCTSLSGVKVVLTKLYVHLADISLFTDDNVANNYCMIWKVRAYANLVSNLQYRISVTKQIFKLVTHDAVNSFML